MKAYKEGKLTEAIQEIDKCIKIEPENAVFVYNKGVFLYEAEEIKVSIVWFSKSIELDPAFKKAWNARGNAKQDIREYKGAIQDYKKAIEIDETYVDAHWNMAETYEILEDFNSAFLCFQKAEELGDKSAGERIKAYKKEGLIKDKTLTPTEVSKDKEYGYSEKKPIKVNSEIYAGPSGQRYYLDQLAGADGQPISYRRVNSCCAYQTDKAAMGMALLDVYEITYVVKKRKTITKNLYLDFYEYEKPMVPVGLYLLK